jgi:hypothetical protein
MVDTAGKIDVVSSTSVVRSFCSRGLFLLDPQARRVASRARDQRAFDEQ